MGKKKATCKCIDDINGQLEPKGYRLDLAFTIGGEVFPMLALERVPGVKPKRGSRAPIVPATHCAFCGTAYQKGMPR